MAKVKDKKNVHACMHAAKVARAAVRRESRATFAFEATAHGPRELEADEVGRTKRGRKQSHHLAHRSEWPGKGVKEDLALLFHFGRERRFLRRGSSLHGETRKLRVFDRMPAPTVVMHAAGGLNEARSVAARKRACGSRGRDGVGSRRRPPSGLNRVTAAAKVVKMARSLDEARPIAPREGADGKGNIWRLRRMRRGHRRRRRRGVHTRSVRAKHVPRDHERPSQDVGAGPTRRIRCRARSRVDTSAPILVVGCHLSNQAIARGEKKIGKSGDLNELLSDYRQCDIANDKAPTRLIPRRDFAAKDLGLVRSGCACDGRVRHVVLHHRRLAKHDCLFSERDVHHLAASGRRRASAAAKVRKDKGKRLVLVEVGEAPKFSMLAAVELHYRERVGTRRRVKPKGGKIRWEPTGACPTGADERKRDDGEGRWQLN